MPLYAVGIDARPGEAGVLAAVERHIARGDAGVGVGGFILLFHADLQTGAQRMGVFAGVRIDLAGGVLVERLAAFGVGFNAQAPVVLMLLVLGGLQQDTAVFRLERGAAAADLGALQMQRVIALCRRRTGVTLPSEASVASWRSVADSFTLAMSNAPPAERLPPVFSLLSLLPAPRSRLPDSWLSLRVWVDSAACSATLLPALRGDVALAFNVGAFKRQIAARLQFNALLAVDVADLCGTAAAFAFVGTAAEAGAEVLLSAVKPPFAEALTLKPLWFSLCLSLA